jgi:single-stranded-DNA-specific exonuclease
MAGAWLSPPDPGSAEAGAADELSDQFHLPAPVGRAIYLRGLTTPDGWRDFIAAEKAEFPPTEPLRNLPEAARHLAEVCRSGGSVLVHGDYDVDGISGTALLTRTLNLWGAKATPFLPSRFAEGYGIAAAAIEKVRAEKFSTLVTADCGSNHGALLDDAAAAGATVIVCDHHLLIPGQQPKAALLINPHQPGDASGKKNFCGTAIALELLLATGEALGKVIPYASLAQLAAIASVTDVMELTGRTRALVAAGLKALPSARSAGLKALLKQCRIVAPVRTEDIGFAIGPRLNAAGRMGHPGAALDLLLAPDAPSAAKAMAAIEQCNIERRALSERIFQSALAQARTQEDKPVIAVGDNGWHLGVMGIVAQRLREAMNRPAIAVAFENGLGTGSGRSGAGVHLEALISRQRQFLIKAGGHAVACGLTVAEDQWEKFRAALWQDAATLDAPVVLLARADAVVATADLNLNLLNSIHALEPWGEGMAAPLFEVHGSLTNLRRFGREAEKPHAELTLRGAQRPFIFWRGAERMKGKSGPVKLLVRPGRDEFVVEDVEG